MSQGGPALGSRIPTSAADHLLGNSVGAIGWPVEISRRLRPREVARVGALGFGPASQSVNDPSPPCEGRPSTLAPSGAGVGR